MQTEFQGQPFVEPEEPVPAGLMHSAEALHTTSQHLALLFPALLPVAERAVRMALLREAAAMSAPGLVQEARRVLGSLLDDPELLEELQADDAGSHGFAESLHQALVSASDPEADSELLSRQVKLRATDLARATAAQVLSIRSTQELQALSASVQRHGLNASEAEDYLNQVASRLIESMESVPAGQASASTAYAGGIYA